MILKAGTGLRPTAEPSAFHLRDLVAEGESILDAARAQAAAILASAEQEAVALREVARTAGHAEGLEAGRAHGQRTGHDTALSEAREQFNNDHTAVVTSLQSLIEQVNTERAQRLHAAERDILHFALGLVRRVIKIAVRADHDAVQHNLEAALAMVMDRSDLVIRVHPDEFKSMERVCHDLLEDVDHRQHVQVLTDDGIHPGGAVVETPDGVIDATIEHQLDQIAHMLLGETTPPPTEGADV